MTRSNNEKKDQGENEGNLALKIGFTFSIGNSGTSGRAHHHDNNRNLVTTRTGLWTFPSNGPVQRPTKAWPARLNRKLFGVWMPNKIAGLTWRTFRVRNSSRTIFTGHPDEECQIQSVLRGVSQFRPIVIMPKMDGMTPSGRESR